MSDAKRRSKRRRGGFGIENIILIAAIVIFFISAFQLYRIAKGYLDGRTEYQQIRDLVLQIDEDKGEEGDGFNIDFDELLKINPDTVGWIRFDPEPKEINYPIVQGRDNQEYLHKTFSANENTLGAIFLNVQNNPNFKDENTIIYGHRMRDGSMFRHLQDYESKDFWEENQYFYIYTLDGRKKLTYHIYSCGTVVETSDTYKDVFESNEEFEEFVKMTKDVAMYDTGVEVGAGNRIVTLSTCTSASDEHRFVVRGVLENIEDMPPLEKDEDE